MALWFLGRNGFLSIWKNDHQGQSDVSCIIIFSGLNGESDKGLQRVGDLGVISKDIKRHNGVKGCTWVREGEEK